MFCCQKSVLDFSGFHPFAVVPKTLVIYNYVFVGFYFVSNLIVIMFNLLYPVFIVRSICKNCVCERKSVKTEGKLKTEVFSWVSCKKALPKRHS